MTDKPYNLILGDCLEVMKTLADNSVDSIVTDPPYFIGFMNKEFDKAKDNIAAKVELWQEALRVLKPGGHLLAFGAARTHHRLFVAIEDAGFEIRDTITWLFGSGFPKSHNISKAIDSHFKVEREVVGQNSNGSGAQPNKLKNHGQGDTGIGYADGSGKVFDITAPTTDEAKQWQGFGTALKPAAEYICLARKPLAESTIAKNVLKWGTGAINIDGCRVPTDATKDDMLREVSRQKRQSETWEKGSGFKNESNSLTGVRSDGRFPANLIHDGSDEVEAEFAKFGEKTNGHWSYKQAQNGGLYELGLKNLADAGTDKTKGSASRFFYCAKASKADRNDGCESLELKQTWASQEKRESNSFDVFESDGRIKTTNQNHHPTVKPHELMKYLCRLITPPNGTVLDMFMGSGSTGKAAIAEGFHFIGIEKEKEYLDIAEARLSETLNSQPLFAKAA